MKNKVLKSFEFESHLSECFRRQLTKKIFSFLFFQQLINKTEVTMIDSNGIFSRISKKMLNREKRFAFLMNERHESQCDEFDQTTIFILFEVKRDMCLMIKEQRRGRRRRRRMFNPEGKFCLIKKTFHHLSKLSRTCVFVLLLSG